MLMSEATTARSRMAKVCEAIAAPAAAAVDTNATFPTETFAALKRERLMGLLVPKADGGEGLSLAEIADLCRLLARACGSSGMIYAMHYIKLHNLVSSAGASPWHRAFMRRVADEQLLLGSATTEAGIGGDLRNSVCAVEADGARFRVRKEATVISYGVQSDAIFVTARRSPGSPSNDQVMVALTRDQYTLDKTHAWDTLGMRGTCSEGFVITGEAGVEQIFPQPFAELAAQSMLAASHILWGSVWYGIAQEAFGRAQAMVRAEARKKPDVKPVAATPLAEASVKLHQVRAVLVEAIARFERAEAEPATLEAMSFSIAMNNLKVMVSRLSCEVTLEALRIAGIAGYKNDTPYSVGRQLRDVLSAPLMIANDRVISNLSATAALARFDAGLVE